MSESKDELQLMISELQEESKKVHRSKDEQELNKDDVQQLHYYEIEVEDEVKEYVLEYIYL